MIVPRTAAHKHYDTLEIADHVIVLDKGQIVEQGSPDDLRRSQVPLVRDFLQEALNAETS